MAVFFSSSIFLLLLLKGLGPEVCLAVDEVAGLDDLGAGPVGDRTALRVAGRHSAKSAPRLMLNFVSVGGVINRHLAQRSQFLCSHAGGRRPLHGRGDLRSAASRHGHGVGVVDDPDEDVPLLRLDDLAQLTVVLQHQHLLRRVALLEEFLDLDIMCDHFSESESFVLSQNG